VARKGFFKKLAESIGKVFGAKPKQPPKPAAPKPRPIPPKPTYAPTPPPPKPTHAPAPPSPAVAREQLYRKLYDQYWLMDQWDSPATSRRIDRMTDAQVYAALGLSEDDLDTAVREVPEHSVHWASMEDPDANVLWYHSEGKVAAS
jgi:hypothetical protein